MDPQEPPFPVDRRNKCQALDGLGAEAVERQKRFALARLAGQLTRLRQPRPVQERTYGWDPNGLRHNLLLLEW